MTSRRRHPRALSSSERGTGHATERHTGLMGVLALRDFRRLWIVRINAGARENGLSYNAFIHGLKLAEIELDRKVLADMAVTDPASFASLVDKARAAIEAAA